MPDRVSRLTRRAFVAVSAGTAAAALTGCSALDSIFDVDSEGSGAGTPTSPAVDADSALVEQIGVAIATAAALATATASAAATLRPLGTRLARIHAAHLGELGRSDVVAPPQVTANKDVALGRLLRNESALQNQLVAAAGSAASGALAQVFASMAAALAQQAAVRR